MGNDHSGLLPLSLKRPNSTPHRLMPPRHPNTPSISSPSYNNLSGNKSIAKESNGCQKEWPCDGSSPPPSPAQPIVPYVLLPSPTAGFVSATVLERYTTESDFAYALFLHNYPQYLTTWHVDSLRRSEYGRLASDETYVDYMGGALYPASLISAHADFLQTAVLGNTHSESPSSKLSAALTATARAAVLSFFNAPTGSTVIFTPNATAALKLVGEAFPFTPGAAFILPEDAHNSVQGIREFAKAKGAPVVYLSSPPQGGVRVKEAFTLIEKHRPSAGTPRAFRIYWSIKHHKYKAAHTVLAHAARLGFTTLLDAAALAPTTPIDLTKTPVDAVAVSFYKMFGFPTGIGALVLAPGIGAWLRDKRPWFAGGTVAAVQVPGTVVHRKSAIDEAFEDGTLNYALLPAVTNGLRLLSAYLPALPLRIAALSASCARLLEDIRWPRSGVIAVRVLSRIPGASPESGEEVQGAGGVVSCLMFDEKGCPIPLSKVAAHAAANGIALRTGCMCNPGGAAALLSLDSPMSVIDQGESNRRPTLRSHQEVSGSEFGIVRISFGLASCWMDVWRVRCWVVDALNEQWTNSPREPVFSADQTNGHPALNAVVGGRVI
ncbi:PLP-dependent transferase [Russula earlei]|uniref:PLP-dependent transferase n=1 Tax=Russula earlei TaxID=71964 RepID=A0ACC0UFJ1_9AGAM|nr:PLP-dependent transferase [Russula earlei]